MSLLFAISPSSMAPSTRHSSAHTHPLTHSRVESLTMADVLALAEIMESADHLAVVDFKQCHVDNAMLRVMCTALLGKPRLNVLRFECALVYGMRPSACSVEETPLCTFSRFELSCRQHVCRRCYLLSDRHIADPACAHPPQRPRSVMQLHPANLYRYL